ncbi:MULTISPECIES: TauD/TfdA family dioxygenase [unclassified Novosphingobium]|uniref:TauD/TfdA family dioxygenase n=1 Tax=unclassified Novosphingobium TaxID=2644732 RepID=UPI00135AFC17|nr:MULTISPECIES: TauD/TfdA family dioxygenase [unclassified Novosphingobium]
MIAPEINKEAVEHLKRSLFWRIDDTMNPAPSRCSILPVRFCLPRGDNTEFSNCYAAFDDLPPETKAAIDNLRVIQSMSNTGLYHTPEPSLPQLKD